VDKAVDKNVDKLGLWISGGFIHSPFTGKGELSTGLSTVDEGQFVAWASGIPVLYPHIHRPYYCY
jgi:hypothetical protein